MTAKTFIAYVVCSFTWMFVKVSSCDPLSLMTKTWNVTSITDATGNNSAVLPMPNSQVTIIFNENGELYGSGGCNQYGASFTADDSVNSVTVNGLYSTERYCSDTADQESTYFAALDRASSYSIVDCNKLELMDEKGMLQISFIDAMSMVVHDLDSDVNDEISSMTSGLTETTWSATSITNLTGTNSAVLPNSEVTVFFNKDGSMHGNGGCNDYKGKYAADKSVNSFTVHGKIGSTMKYCEETLNQELAYFAALKRASSYSIIDFNKLELYDDNLTLQISFVGTTSRKHIKGKDVAVEDMFADMNNDMEDDSAAGTKNGSAATLAGVTMVAAAVMAAFGIA